MKVGDWVRRKPDNYTNVWVNSMKDRHDKALRITRVRYGIGFDEHPNVWDEDLFVIDDRQIFNELIDKYYEGR